MSALQRSAFTVCALLLVGCAAGRSPAVESARKQAMEAYVGCLNLAAEELDDGLSEVTVVALVVKAKCSKAFNEVTQVFSATMEAPEAHQYFLWADRRRLEAAATAVAQHRLRAS